MSYAVLTPLGNSERNKVSTGANALFTAAAAGGTGYGVAIDATSRQDKIAILITASVADSAVKIKAGNAKSFGALQDLTIDVAKDKYYLLTLDTAKYEQVQENDTLKTLSGLSSVKGKIIISCTAATTTFAVIKESI